MSLRLPVHQQLPGPDALGLPADVVAGLRSALRFDNGLILVCGPTGAGKTTTLQSFLLEVAHNQPHRHLLSLEDPIERYLPTVTQEMLLPALRFVMAQRRERLDGQVSVQAEARSWRTRSELPMPGAGAVLGTSLDTTHETALGDDNRNDQIAIDDPDQNKEQAPHATR